MLLHFRTEEVYLENKISKLKTDVMSVVKIQQITNHFIVQHLSYDRYHTEVSYSSKFQLNELVVSVEDQHNTVEFLI